MVMKLELLERRAASSNGGPPLLFVHGAWHGAWCWQRWMPYFSDRGYDCWALSLRGHGGSPETPMGVGGPTLADYVADVASVARSLPAPPVLLGHSMGGAITQLYLAEDDDDHPVAAAALLASMPPRGVIGVIMNNLRADPLSALAAILTFDMGRTVRDPGRAIATFLSPDADQAAKDLLVEKIGTESYRAFLDMLFLRRPRPARARQRPMLVLGAADDVIFPPGDIKATAEAYGVEPVMIDQLAHDVMLERRNTAAADAVLAWLAQLQTH